MSYPYFFIKKADVTGNEIIVKEGLNHLINVLRIRKSDYVEVSDNNKYRYRTEVTGVSRSGVTLLIRERIKIFRRLPHIVLFQCILKKNAMEIAIQKTVEIGIDRIVPVFSSRVITDSKKIENKIKRWQKIAGESSKQCKRDFICKISPSVNIYNIEASEFDVFYIPYESYAEVKNKEINYPGRLGSIDSKISSAKSIGYIIGPEGGFEEREVSFFKKSGAIAVNFGKKILRSETASVYFLSVVDYILSIKAKND